METMETRSEPSDNWYFAKGPLQWCCRLTDGVHSTFRPYLAYNTCMSMMSESEAGVRTTVMTESLIMLACSTAAVIPSVLTLSVLTFVYIS
jgi:hypothetical protein